jgi:Protein of unknown function (DUF2939)
MKRLLLKALLLTIAIGAYIGAPFVTAWSIREAVRDGNSAYLERAIDWGSVRQTLKPTLSRVALNLPDPETQVSVKPGLWQRTKAYWGQGAVNRAIDSYITPEGLPQLFALRKSYRNVTGAIDDSQTLPVTERIKRAWSRVKRAEFTTLTSFEVDMADKHDENRIYVGKLELTATGWMLTELRIKMLTTADATPAQLLMAPLGTVPDAVSPMRGSSPSRGWSTGFIARAEASPLPAPFLAPRTSFWDRAKAAAR